MSRSEQNADQNVIDDFGAEWARFDQSELNEPERLRLFSSYFAIFPWERLPKDARGMDVGCGSGRWARSVAPRVGHLLAVDPASAALSVARKNLLGQANVSFHLTDVAHLPGEDGEFDFAYSLGVLHHVPDTALAIQSVGKKLRPGAPFLIYLYYSLDNRPLWFRGLWRVSNLARYLISSAPRPIKHLACEAIAAVVYWPLARGGRLLERAGFSVQQIPLSAYRSLSYYTMRTDALDRFGTRLEQRFSRTQIQSMLEGAGFGEVRFHEGEPYWCALAFKV